MSAYSTTPRYSHQRESLYIPTYLKKLRPFIHCSSSDNYYLDPNHSFILMETNICWNCEKETKTIAFANSLYSFPNKRKESLQSDELTIFYNIKKLDKKILTKIHESYPDYQYCNKKIDNHQYILINCENCKSSINNPFLFNKLIEPFVDPVNIAYKGNLSIILLDGCSPVSIIADYKIKVTKRQHSLFLQHIKNEYLLYRSLLY